MSSWESLLAVRAARLHLEDGRPLTEIAELLGISRFKAGRLVQSARQAGWVRVEVADPPDVNAELSELLAQRCAHLGVRRALVTADHAGREALARATAEAIEDGTVAGDVLGLACGRTVNHVISAIRRLPACDVVQLTGLAAPTGLADSSVETIRRAARLSGRDVLPVYEPMVQLNAAVATARSRQPGLTQAFARWEHLSIALLTVGAWEAGLSNVYDSATLDEASRVRATRAGAVAEFCGHLVDKNGNRVAPHVTDRCLAVPWGRLQQAREVVAIAADPARSSAVAAALQTGLISTLVAGEQTARALLDLV